MREKKFIFSLFSGYIIGFVVLLLALNTYEGAKYIVYSRYKGNPINTREIHFGSEQNLKAETVKDICNILDENSKIDIDSTNYFVDVLNRDNERNRYRADFISYSKDNFFKFKLLHGRYFTVDELKSNKNVALVNDEVYKFLKVNNLNNCYITINNYKFKVIGVLKNSGIYIYLPIKNLDKVELNDGKGNYFYCNMDISTLNGNVDDLSNRIAMMLKKEYGGNVSIITPELEVSDDIAITYKTLALFSIAILLVSIVNSSNLTLIWINNRSKEITIKKSLGAPNALIIFENVKDLFLISFIAIIIGITVDYFVINKIISNIRNIDLVLNYKVVITAIIFSIMTGILSSIVAANKILKFNIASSLKND